MTARGACLLCAAAAWAFALAATLLLRAGEAHLGGFAGVTAAALTIVAIGAGLEWSISGHRYLPEDKEREALRKSLSKALKERDEWRDAYVDLDNKHSKQDRPS